MKRIIQYFFLLFSIIGCDRNDKKLEFEKIIFHTDENGCWGSCPEYHLEISNNLYTRLWIEKETYEDTIYPLQDIRHRGYLIDSTRLGYYEGKISPEKFLPIKNLIVQTRFDTILNSSEKTQCNDALTKRFILYFKGNQRKEILYNCTGNGQLDSLSKLFYSFINNHQLTKAENSFFLEDFISK